MHTSADFYTDFSKGMPIRIAIVDDKPENRILISEQLRPSKVVEVVLLAKNGQDFLQKMKEADAAYRPQVVLMDIEMPEMNGIDAVEVASTLYPEVHFLMLTVFDDNDKIFDAIKAGAAGYLLKDEKIKVIEEHILQMVEVGGVPMSPSIARKAMNMLISTPAVSHEKHLAAEQEAHELSDRELEVLKLLVSGYDYKVIAERLFLSTHTVRKHIANIYTKLHVSSKAQAINLAHKKRWFE